MLARRCVPHLSNKEGRSVVVALFYSVPVGLHRVCQAGNPRDELIKGQDLVLECENWRSQERE